MDDIISPAYVVLREVDQHLSRILVLQRVLVAVLNECDIGQCHTATSQWLECGGQREIPKINKKKIQSQTTIKTKTETETEFESESESETETNK
jgi:hypothetical protein